jgi:uncharacterized membrane protein YgdD (TMEM256/DUF423 family)
MIDKQVKIVALLGAFVCLLAVAIGAFGAHAFKDILAANQKTDVYDLANRYQFYHGLALLLIAALFNRSEVEPKLKALGVLMFLGTLIFSGSLYLLALLNISWLGAITPIGGVLLLIAWLMLLLQIVKLSR